jgi:hypothetical protein
MDQSQSQNKDVDIEKIEKEIKEDAEKQKEITKQEIKKEIKQEISAETRLGELEAHFKKQTEDYDRMQAQLKKEAEEKAALNSRITELQEKITQRQGLVSNENPLKQEEPLKDLPVGEAIKVIEELERKLGRGESTTQRMIEASLGPARKR